MKPRLSQWEHQSSQDRWDEYFYEEKRLKSEAAKAAKLAERARIKAHGLVKTSHVRHKWLFGKHVTTHRCPVCNKTGGIVGYSAICTGVRIRKERRGPDGQSLDFPPLK